MHFRFMYNAIFVTVIFPINLILLQIVISRNGNSFSRCSHMKMLLFLKLKIQERLNRFNEN